MIIQMETLVQEKEQETKTQESEKNDTKIDIDQFITMGMVRAQKVKR